ncbi:MAG: Ycf66 family protein [Cyanobacteria bacterium J06643_13]
MLSYALAIAVAISSLVLFSTAFLMPKIHRQDDFLWSGVGLFYALILWYCARNIAGAVLLGQAAATALLISSSWQVIKLRRIVADPTRASTEKSFSVANTVRGFWKRKQPKVEASAAPEVKAPMPTVTEEIAIPETPAEIPHETPTKTSTKTADASSSSGNLKQPNKEEPAKDQIKAEVKTDVEVQPVAQPAETADISPIQFVDRQAFSEGATPAATPLPNKLPESVEPATKPAPVDSSSAKTNQPSATGDITPPALTISGAAATKADDGTEKTTISSEEALPSNVSDSPAENQEKVVSNTEKSTATESIENPDLETAQPASPLDSLETVEVAEVLEAEPDNSSNIRESDRANIIEVTTTDINPDQEQKNRSESK